MAAIDRARTEKGFVDADLSYKMGLPTRLYRETESEKYHTADYNSH